MLDPKVLEKRADVNGQLYIGVTVVLKLRGYDFFFRRQPEDFVPEDEFVPFFWRRKRDDPDSEDASKDNDQEGSGDPSHLADSSLVNMDVDAEQVPGGSHGSVVEKSTHSAPLFAVTPFNPFPRTPRAVEIVEAARQRSPGLFAQNISPAAPSSPVSPAVLGLQSAPRMGHPSTTPQVLVGQEGSTSPLPSCGAAQAAVVAAASPFGDGGLSSSSSLETALGGQVFPQVVGQEASAPLPPYGDDLAPQ
jgi:hypothetical protein